MKDKIESSEQSVIKLKRHIENGTCPPELFYDAKANIFPDEDFYSDIKAIQKEAEQKFLGALIKFHNCRIVHNQAQLRKAKSCNKNTSVKGRKSQSESCNIPESLKAITANLEKRLEEVNATLYDLKEANNKTVETYTHVVSESGSSNKDYGIRKRKSKNKKHPERRQKTHKDIRAMKTESRIWEPPVQQSVTLESYLEEIKIQLAHTQIPKAIPNLSLNERKAIPELKTTLKITSRKRNEQTR